MLCGHAICFLEMEYAVWTWYIYIYILYYIYIYKYYNIYICISRRHIACPHSIFYPQKTYSMSIQHIPCPYSIFYPQKTYSMSIQHIACPYSIFYPQKTYSMSIQHIPCLQSIHIASIYIPEGPYLKNSRFWLFPRFIPWPSGYVWVSSLILFMGFSNFQKICFRNVVFIIF